MGGVRLIPHHTNQNHRDKNTAKAVNGENNETEHRIAEPWELLTNEGNHCGENRHAKSDHFRLLVVLTPFRLHVIGDGGCASQDLTVRSRHCGSKNRCEDDAAKERAQLFHGQHWQPSLGTIRAQLG